MAKRLSSSEFDAKLKGGYWESVRPGRWCQVQRARIAQSAHSAIGAEKKNTQS